MDRAELEKGLLDFEAACSKEGKAISTCLVEGLQLTEFQTYILEVQAHWMYHEPCSDVLEYLIPILFRTTPPELRKQIFFIKVLNEEGNVHCFENLPQPEGQISSTLMPL